MSTITLHDKSFKPFIRHEEIIKAIDEVASKINEDFKDCEDTPIILCTLTGAIMFTSELMKRLNFNCKLSAIKLKSYEGTSTTGEVKEAMGLTSDVSGQRVIIVEDIVDTGNTIVKLTEILKDANVKSTSICTLLFKPNAYKKDINIDYKALEIGNEFIVGFGLDYDELGRNLKDIYVIAE